MAETSLSDQFSSGLSYYTCFNFLKVKKVVFGKYGKYDKKRVGEEQNLILISKIFSCHNLKGE